MMNQEFFNLPQEGNETTEIMEALCKELHIAYQKFGWIWIDKFIWSHGTWNEIDKLGIGKVICQSIVNAIVSDPMTIWTPSERINKLIELELFGRMKFNSTFSQNLAHCMANGDMLMSLKRDEFDNQLAIHYIQGNNLIPIAYNEHAVHRVAWFTREYVGKDTYVILTIEDKFSRVKILYKYAQGTLVAIDFGTNEWNLVMGKEPDIVEFNDGDNSYKRFAWVSTARQDGKWKNTPFHNSFLYPLCEIERINKTWDQFNNEYDLGPKSVFADPELLETTNAERERQHLPPIDWDKVPPIGGLFRSLTVDKDKLFEHNPQLRFPELYGKFKFDLQMLCASRGLNASILQLELPTKEMTATESVLSNKQTQNTIKNIEANLKPAIQTIVYALICEWYKDGIISDEDFNSISSVGCIDVQFSDGFFRNKEQTVNMMLGIWNAPTTDGSKMMTEEKFLHEALGWSKEHCEYTVAAAKEQHKQNILQNAALQAEANLIMATAMPQQAPVEEKEEKPKKSKKEGKK